MGNSATRMKGFRPGMAALLLLSPVAAAAVGGPAPEGAVAEAGRGDVIMLLVYVLLALVVSFLCSVAEAVLLSITPSYIAGLREHKPGRAALLQTLKQDKVDRSLAGILTLNTIAHTVGAIGSGAKATIVFGSAWFGLFSAVMTLMILFLSEIIPKTIGAVHWRSLTGVTAHFVRGLIVLLWPLIKVAEGLTRLVARDKGHQLFNREEFVAMAQVGEQAGEIRADESRIIGNLFRFGTLVAKDVMTPRVVVVGLQRDLSVAEALAAVADRPFTRMPLYGADLDEITGFVLRADLLLAAAEGRTEGPVAELEREVLTVAAETSLSDVLETFLDERRQLARVTGDFGGTMGLVTLEDVVETLLGTEIVDEDDAVGDMQALARRRWARRAASMGLDVDAIDSSGL